MLGRSARVLAEVAREAGHAPWVIDLFGDADTRACAMGIVTLSPTRAFGFRQRELLSAIEALQQRAGPMPVVPGSAFEATPATLARIATRWPTLACDAQVYQALLDPPRLWRVLRRAHDIATPDTRWTPPRAPRAWLLKRAGGSGGDHLRPATRVAGARDYFQRRHGGQSLSASFLSAGTRCRLVGIAAHLRWHARDGYRYEGARALARPSRALESATLRIGMALTARLGLRGLWGFDFLLDAAGEVTLVDINPRPPVTLELWSDRASVFDAHLAACASGTLLYSRPRRETERAHLVLYAEASWRASANIRWPAWVADRPASGVDVPRGAPLCTLLADGRDEHELAARLTRRYARLRRMLGLEHVLPPAIRIRSMGG
ncbi:MAG: ATP-grasp domain-containing protein [Gammaproteobacteria bacterium]